MQLRVVFSVAGRVRFVSPWCWGGVVRQAIGRIVG